MSRASLVLLFVLLLAGTAVQALSTMLATVAARPDVATPIAPAAQGDPGPAAPLRFGSACADIVNRSDRLLRPPRRFDDTVRGEGPCVVF
jgi:hypothetical protein